MSLGNTTRLATRRQPESGTHLNAESTESGRPTNPAP